MIIPETPSPAQVERISPSLYEVLLGCPAKAAWYTQGERGKLAPHPAALLGTAFHGVMEAANKGQFQGPQDERRNMARTKFDALAASAYSSANPLLKTKFSSPEKLPFYNQQRELAALLASEVDLQVGSGTTGEVGAGGAERWFQSSDGKLGGRPDLLDREGQEVIDYKTGYVPEEQGSVVSDREVRQLNLYAYLARESGFDIARGRIIRANGRQASVDISIDQANSEAAKALATLDEFNALVDGSSFEDLARPAPDVCAMCDCIPLCEQFWNDAEDSWMETTGVHVQGIVVDVQAGQVQGTALATLKIEASRGTVEPGEVTIEQVPLSWFTADGDREPMVGDLIRLVNGRLTNAEDPVRVRADRTMTAVWRVLPANPEGEVPE
jgi:CRISPR/Cas system-associated exonuclease Cas4 (RecB family)